MKIVYKGKKQKIIDAVDYVNDLFDEESFWGAISEKGSFDNSEHSPANIAQFMKNKEGKVELKLYKPRWPRHRKTNAYTDPSYPDTLFYNSKKLWRNVGSIVNTIVHEYVHSVDFTEDGSSRIDYGHGSQSSSGKGSSAPYWIGALAEKFFESEITEDPVIESITIEPSDIIDES